MEFVIHPHPVVALGHAHTVKHQIFVSTLFSRKFAKFKCTRKFSAGPELSETFYGLKIGQIAAEIQLWHVIILFFGKIAAICLKIVRFSIRNHRWKAKDMYYSNPPQIREN